MEKINEEWRPVIGYEGVYEVSSLGRVRSLDRYVNTAYGKRIIRGQICKPHLAKNGYHRIALSRNRIPVKFKVSRLVAEAFIPNPENKPEVDHINTVKTDDRVENLRWVTREENVWNPLTAANRKRIMNSEEYKKKISKLHKGRKRSAETCNNIRNGLLNSTVKKRHPVEQYTLDGVFVKLWPTVRSVYEELGINTYDCCNGRCKTSGGFVWRYATI